MKAKLLPAFLFLALVLAACAPPGIQPAAVEAAGPGGNPPAAKDQAVGLDPGEGQSPAVEKSTFGTACPVTEPVFDQPPDDPNADPFGEGPYFRNAARSLWVSAPPPDRRWHAGGSKVAFIRPAGTDVEVSGRRLDGEAPPLHAELPCCYPTGFQVGGLTFPTEGCWEVNVRAGDEELVFTTLVDPPQHPPAGGVCESLADAVALSDAIVLGDALVSDVTVERPGGGRYDWQEVAVRGLWKRPPGWSGVGDRLHLLLDTRAGPALQDGQRYLLFLQYEPWQLVCPERSVIAVDLLNETTAGLGDNPLWAGGTLAELNAAVESVQSK